MVVLLIIDELLDSEAIAPPENMNLLVQRMVGWIIDDLKTEDEIDRETRRILFSYSKPLEEGSEAWDIKFRQTREDLAERRGYVL